MEAVEVVVEEETGERQRQQRIPANRRSGRFVDEQAVALVRVERHHLVREIADDEARAAGFVVVGGVGAHARARHPRLVEGHTGRHGDIGERAVAPIAIEPVRLCVIRNEQVDPPIAIVIDQCGSERL